MPSLTEPPLAKRKTGQQGLFATEKKIINGSVQTHIYDINMDQFIIPRLKVAITQFFETVMFIKHEQLAVYQYIAMHVKFISSLLTYLGHEHERIVEYSSKECVKDNSANILYMLNLTQTEFLTIKDMNIHVWGPRFWSYMHLISFAIRENKDLILQFAALMLTFNLALPCKACSAHYIAKLPLDNVTIPMQESQDPVTIIYTLHNLVNISTGKTVFGREQFLNLYEATSTPSKLVDFRVVDDF